MERSYSVHPLNAADCLIGRDRLVQSGSVVNWNLELSRDEDAFEDIPQYKNTTAVLCFNDNVLPS